MMLKPSYDLCLILFIIILCGSSTLVTSQLDSCDSKINPQIVNDIPFDTSSLQCVNVWSAHNFILRYGKDSSSTANAWNFVFSFPASINAYAAMGFSGDGNMVGSTALVAWAPPGGAGGEVFEYYLGGKSPDQVTKGQGQGMSGSSDGASPVYVWFKLMTPQPSTNLLFAIGPKGVFPQQPRYSLARHSEYIATVIDYDKGKIKITKEGGTTYYQNLRRSHGVISSAGWSILMIIGTMIARYGKQWDPTWFYLHASIQTFGFIAGLVGIICGLALRNKLNAAVTQHKNIAILILVLGFLQVLAIKLRPGLESKIRKYWNWYHHNVGRILIMFAVANSIYGLRLGGEGFMWFVAYGVIIVVLVIIAAILEIRMRIISKKMASQFPSYSEYNY